jgi:hypothetical protein
VVALELGVPQGEHGSRELSARHHPFQERARGLARRDLEEVDDLRHDEGVAGRAHLGHEGREPGHETVMAEA